MIFSQQVMRKKLSFLFSVFYFLLLFFFSFLFFMCYTSTILPPSSFNAFDNSSGCLFIFLLFFLLFFFFPVYFVQYNAPLIFLPIVSKTQEVMFSVGVFNVFHEILFLDFVRTTSLIFMKAT